MLTRTHPNGDHTWCFKVWGHLTHERPWWRVADVVIVLSIIQCGLALTGKASATAAQAIPHLLLPSLLTQHVGGVWHSCR